MNKTKPKTITEIITNFHLFSKKLEVQSAQLDTLYSLLNDQQKESIVKTTLQKYFESQELKQFQVELIKMQSHLERTKKKMIILFDGRDASGKGSTIRSIGRYMNEKHFRVVALGKPTKTQQTELHIKRYIEQFPRAGEIVLFNRSWYNRATVEPVMNFCTRDQYKRFLKKITQYENNFISDSGQTILLKIYLSVSKIEQANRFRRRSKDQLRQWKLSEVDLQAQDLWDEFSRKKMIMLQRTHTSECPWWIIKSDDKHLARRETMKLILRTVKYYGRKRNINFTADPTVLVPGDIELQKIKRQIKQNGKPLA